MVDNFWQFEQDGRWYRMTKLPNGDGYIILAKKEGFGFPTFGPVLEHGELWFEFGETINEALDNMKVIHCEFNLLENR